MPTAQATSADAELIHRLASRGARVTARQLQEWRRLGILVSPEIVRHGRRGTEALSYPTAADEQVETIIRMLKVRRDMDLVVLGLFGVGVDPNEDALRGAYRSYLEKNYANDIQNKALSDAGGKAFTRRVNRFASGIRKMLPEIVDRWNDDAASRARAESQEIDRATGKAELVTSRDVRERDADAFLRALLGEEGGDARALLRAFGMRDERVEEMHEDGGVPSYQEQLSVLDATNFEVMLAIRDHIREAWEEFVAEEMPQALREFLDPLIATPEIFGLTVATGVVSALVFAARQEGDETVATT